jgi:hypothetical protein
LVDVKWSQRKNDGNAFRPIQEFEVVSQEGDAGTGMLENLHRHHHSPLYRLLQAAEWGRMVHLDLAQTCTVNEVKSVYVDADGVVVLVR